MTDPNADIARLVRAAQGGDRDAFAALYQRYGRMIHGILLAYVTGGEVDDLTQDVFLHAMERLSSLREPAAFGRWIGTIARTRALDHMRRAPKTETLPDDVAGALDDRSEAIWILAAIRELPVAYRETLMLRLVEGMNGPEIADRTGLTPGSVRVNLSRGMQQLRTKLRRSAP